MMRSVIVIAALFIHFEGKYVLALRLSVVRHANLRHSNSIHMGHLPSQHVDTASNYKEAMFSIADGNRLPLHYRIRRLIPSCFRHGFWKRMKIALLPILLSIVIVLSCPFNALAVKSGASVGGSTSFHSKSSSSGSNRRSSSSGGSSSSSRSSGSKGSGSGGGRSSSRSGSSSGSMGGRSFQSYSASSPKPPSYRSPPKESYSGSSSHTWPSSSSSSSNNFFFPSGVSIFSAPRPAPRGNSAVFVTIGESSQTGGGGTRLSTSAPVSAAVMKRRQQVISGLFSLVGIRVLVDILRSKRDAEKYKKNRNAALLTNEGEDNNRARDILGTTVVKLQLALNADWGVKNNVMSALLTAASGPTKLSSRTDIARLLNEASLALLRRESDWVAAAYQASVYQSTERDSDQAENTYHRLVVQERAKFEEETRPQDQALIGTTSSSYGISNSLAADASSTHASSSSSPSQQAATSAVPTIAVVSIIAALQGVPITGEGNPYCDSTSTKPNGQGKGGSIRGAGKFSIFQALRDFGRFGNALRGEVSTDRNNHLTGTGTGTGGRPTATGASSVGAGGGSGMDTQTARTVNGIRSILQAMAQDSLKRNGENVVAVEVLWTPSGPGDRVTTGELITDYPELISL